MNCIRYQSEGDRSDYLFPATPLIWMGFHSCRVIVMVMAMVMAMTMAMAMTIVLVIRLSFQHGRRKKEESDARPSHEEA